jgi:hypothetical protein
MIKLFKIVIFITTYFIHNFGDQIWGEILEI